MLFNNKVKYLTIKIEDQKMNLRSEKLEMTQSITMGLKLFMNSTAIIYKNNRNLEVMKVNQEAKIKIRNNNKKKGTIRTKQRKSKTI